MWRWALGLMIILMVIPEVSVKAEAGIMDMHFIDVGQADSILIHTPQGKNILIDAGNVQSSAKLANYLHDQHVATFDAVFATHPHHDHIGGMSRIMKEFQVNAFYMPDLTHSTHAFRALYQAVKKEGIMVFKAKAGDKVEVEPGIMIKIIGPLKGRYDSLNDYSYVLKVIYKGNSFLLMADAGEQSETALLEKKVNVKADVIKIGHHGADSGTTLPFLKTVNPEAAIISAGKHSRYLPSKAVINRLRYLKIPTYRTDLLGTIVAHTDGTHIAFTYGQGEANTQPHQKMRKKMGK
ncbi:ComEC/Rec2 family competence protein [Camelliibacillus cellulosilyticus]|uniref:ComEC/Rec2 family competence protein n=1 Tax=Camelliibacillus cellulosilyticus TaxID=2174486 RepID=A0ABV9GP46_9BACL